MTGKQNLTEVLLFQEGKGVVSLGGFQTPALAKYHIETTFANETGRLLTRKAGKGVKALNESIVSDKGVYSIVKAKLETTSLDVSNIEYEVTNHTLLALVNEGVIKNAKGVGKIERIDAEEGYVAVRTVVSETTPTPYEKIATALEKAVIEALTGDGEDVEEDAEPVVQKESKKAEEKPAVTEDEPTAVEDNDEEDLDDEPVVDGEDEEDLDDEPVVDDEDDDEDFEDDDDEDFEDDDDEDFEDDEDDDEYFEDDEDDDDYEDIDDEDEE